MFDQYCLDCRRIANDQAYQRSKIPNQCKFCGIPIKDKGKSRKNLCSQECELLYGHKRCENGCWEWQRDTLNTGYGYISSREKKELAHRISFEFFNQKIPDGKIIRHKCNNPKCICPDHLEIGDQCDNIHDAQRLGNIKRKLNWEQVCEIRQRHSSGESIWKMSKEYKVIYKTIQDIVLFKKWKKDPGF